MRLRLLRATWLAALELASLLANLAGLWAALFALGIAPGPVDLNKSFSRDQVRPPAALAPSA